MPGKLIACLREPLNGLTHCLGCMFAILATVLLALKAGSFLEVAAYLIFGLGMFLLYLSSTLYHWLPMEAAGQRRLRRIDHAMIFIYIAATYTPVCAVALHGGLGWTMLAVIWALALAGVVMKVFWMAPRWLSTALYIVMGWIALGALIPLEKVITLWGVFWLVAGGVMYTVGAVIYAVKRPNFGVMGFHEIFHVFVLAGSVCHFWTIYRYVTS